ncbi:signal peptidase I [Zavarzinia compransoris]|uniref:Signal peptidase I n=1 Tax=Zavarzinia compransoris TaxID=1264899 RepID=A0A317EBT5_9PROT|nr:signal peptidase I [Zavarzinia compransoris]PWR23580.1 signal peptidase I [Zavarzinia compransoris]
MKQSGRSSFMETVRTVIYAVLIALVIRSFLFEPFNIPSGSMRPTLEVGDYLFVSKFSYGYSRYSMPLGLDLFEGRVLESVPERGDVAVFRKPNEPNTDYIKRIVGLPGDRIQVTDGVLIVNGTPVPRERIDDYVETLPNGGVRRIEQYRETLPNGVTYTTFNLVGGSKADNTGVYEVPPGHYFAMGDNRDDSIDSRFPPEIGGVGFIPAENLIGRADLIFFSSDGSAGLFEPWKWFGAIRYERLLHVIR